MNNELKPCPFCGSADVQKEYDSELPFNRVRCNNCESSSGIYDDMKYAVEAWNRRANDEQIH